MATILIIEDDPLVCELIEEILTDAGHRTILTAEDGVIGMEVARTRNPDLVITDIVMPNKDGVTVIRELKELNPKIKTIAISGGGFNTPQYYLKIADQLGAGRVIRKPVDEEDLLAAIDTVMK
jgi:YesN/AraC family two-component response regulator